MAFFASVLAYLATVGSIAFALAVSLCAFFSNPAPPAIAHRAAILAAKPNPAHVAVKTASASSSSRKDLPVVHGSRAQHQRAIVEARRKAQMAKLRERRLTQEARQWPSQWASRQQPDLAARGLSYAQVPAAPYDGIW